MKIPSGSWCVVRRHVKDRKSKGEIVQSGIAQDEARRLALWMAEPNHNFWAMHIDQYDNPFAEVKEP